ncbi:MAG: YegP family protein [Berryella intestinalis]|uniref:YegP family protein n=1 Tax=Berryella intestinalis TaxID=1531429 RepID=UPI002A58C7F0|nr:YegP family protein [Berryella intestinalis]MDD7369499.1 YegP family protein [Berryella intestinalis]MDY3129505.1 YegP family protein [Berryella intestinalis]
MGKFEVRETNTGFKFDLKAANGQVIATSQVYSSKDAAKKGCASVAKAAEAPIVDAE